MTSPLSTLSLVSAVRALCDALEAETRAHEVTRRRQERAEAHPTAPVQVIVPTPPEPQPMPPDTLPGRWGQVFSRGGVVVGDAPPPPAPMVVHPVTEPEPADQGSPGGISDPGPTVAVRRPVILACSTVEEVESCRLWDGWARQARTLDPVVEDMIIRCREVDLSISAGDLTVLRELAEGKSMSIRPGLLGRVRSAIETLEAAVVSCVEPEAATDLDPEPAAVEPEPVSSTSLDELIPSDDSPV